MKPFGTHLLLKRFPRPQHKKKLVCYVNLRFNLYTTNPLQHKFFKIKGDFPAHVLQSSLGHDCTGVVGRLLWGSAWLHLEPTNYIYFNLKHMLSLLGHLSLPMKMTIINSTEDELQLKHASIMKYSEHC